MQKLKAREPKCKESVHLNSYIFQCSHIKENNFNYACNLLYMKLNQIHGH